MSVYFAKVGRYIKIGHSENPARRVARLWQSTTRYGRPWDLSLTEPRELLVVIDGNLSTEYACHRALQDFAAGCEFFVDEPGVREFMRIAATGWFPKVARVGGEFIPPTYEQAIPERVEEIERMVARRRAS